MKNISDKEILNVLLDEHKLSASAITNLVLESSNESIRNDATGVLNTTFKQQKQIFDLLTQKGFYQTQNADQQSLTRAQQELGNIQTSM